MHRPNRRPWCNSYWAFQRCSGSARSNGPRPNADRVCRVYNRGVGRGVRGQVSRPTRRSASTRHADVYPPGYRRTLIAPLIETRHVLVTSIIIERIRITGSAATFQDNFPSEYAACRLAPPLRDPTLFPYPTLPPA